jgi:thioredoxin reductase (NADPH)
MVYDTIIVGAGIAGLTASIYASRYKLNHLVLDKTPGGQGITAPKVENYPGFLSVDGVELLQKIIEQVKNLGAEIKPEEAKAIAKLNDNLFEVKTETSSYQAKTLILAMGASHKKLGVKGDVELLGKGVAYCVTCDAPLFKDKDVAVVGGGNSAISGVIHLAKFARKVYLIHRRGEYRADPSLVERMRAENKITEITETEIAEINGTERVEGVVLNKEHQGSKNLRVDGVFIEIGQVPASVLVSGLGVELNDNGFIKTDVNTATNISGVFAAGDISSVPGEVVLRQFITSAADGARAAASVYQLLNSGKVPLVSWG